VLVASGVSYRRMDVPGFDQFTDAGVYYGAALTEARSCSQQHVVVIGGANSAGQAAVYFAGYAARVTMLVRGPSLTRSMSTYLIQQIAALPNIEVLTETEALSAEGDDGRLARLQIRGPDGSSRPLDVDACFVFIGAVPRTDWLDGVVARDDRGFILAGADVRDNGWPLPREPYSSPAMSGPSRSSGSPAPSARGRWRCGSSTSIWRRHERAHGGRPTAG
jgi:thioredoxin reductase (NADPH)